MIHCRRCGKAASSALVLCPHCGRELVAAPPRLFLIGAPAILALLLLILIASSWDRGNPISWLRIQVSEAAASLRAMSERIEPSVVIVMTPVPSQAQNIGPVGMPVGALPVAPMESVFDSSAVISVPTPSLSVALATVQPAELAATASQPEGSAPVAAVTTPALPAEVPVEAPTAVPTALSTATEIPSPTPTETVTPSAATEAANSLPTPTPEETSAALVPTDTPVPEETPQEEIVAEASSASMTTYQIQRGDTLVVIAQRFGVDVEALMEINNISPRDVFTIQPGDSLVIPPKPTEEAPLPTATATFTPEPTPAATATPSPTATAAAAGSSKIRLTAPLLRSPGNGAPLNCNARVTLTWQAVPSIRADDKYIVHLGYVDGVGPDNQENVVWLLFQHVPSNRTSWELDGNEYCQYGKEQFGYRWRWWVEVVEEVDGTLRSVSAPSAIWGFSWN